MRRRGFLNRLTVGTAVLAAGSAPYGLARFLAPAVEVAPATHLLPPGAIKDNDAFVSACIGCGLCGEVCPPRCIRFYRREGGGAVNTPYINPEEKGCILCGKCMQVCPTEALTETPLKKIDMGIAQIDRTACYPWVDQGICGACVSICPLGGRAIRFTQWNQYRPAVRAGCVGCGLCVEVCPHPSLPIWIVQRPDGAMVRHTI
ncbi:MAG: 4Fe-4S dicluster domain-containing protein [Gammaproteobacteria bacterium]